MSILKFSVVNAPNGPQMGPGLDFTYQTPNIEREHMDTSSERGETWLPYGGGGEDHFNLEKTKLEFNEPRLQKKKTINKKPVTICIDYDGTITMDPNGFKNIVDRVHKANGKCHLVTGRPLRESGMVKDYCKRYSLAFDSFNFYPIDYDFNSMCDEFGVLLDANIGIWKAEMLEKLGANVMIDDSPVCANVISKKLPNVLILCPLLVGA